MPGRVTLTCEASVDDSSASAKRKSEPICCPTAKRTRSVDEALEAVSEAPRQTWSSASSRNTSRATSPRPVSDGTPGTTPPSSQPVARKPKKKQPSKPRDKKFTCTHDGCDKSFTRPCRLEEHLRSHSGDRPFKCTFDLEKCDKSFLRDSHLKAHIKSMHTKEKPYRCTFFIPPGKEGERGEFGFKRKASVPAEGPDDEDVKECGASFATNQHLKRHVESHLKTFPYICKDHPPCSAGFRKKGPLTRHVRLEHLGLKPWACPRSDNGKPCSAAFDTKGKLGNHVATQHNGLARRRYICTVCITTPGVPVEQPAVSTNDGLHPTTIDIDHPMTDQSAEDASLLLNLSKAAFPAIQMPTPPQPSPDALRSEGMLGFTTHTELRSHITVAHPPKCTRCGYIARRNSDLRTHFREKHEESVEERQSWICGWEGCSQGFTKKSNLTTHTRTVHQGLKPFPCAHPECKKRFGHKAVLARHVAARHTHGQPKQPSQSGQQRSKRKSRKKRTKMLDLAQMLTGYGYEESGREIECLVEGCPYRFCRMYDLRKHLGAISAHGFDEAQVQELTATAAAAAGGKKMVLETESESEESESEWSLAGSETEEDQYLHDDDEN